MFDDAGKAGEAWTEPETWNRVRGETLRKETRGGAVLSQRTALPKQMCQTGEHKRGEGSENASLVVAYWSILWSDSAGRAVNSQGEPRRDGGGSLVEHLHNSHPMWICPSLWERKREGANLTGREWKKECTEISSCDIFSLSPFFFYTAHTMITCSQCGGS